jgi:anaerobic selenocysteine-containing dehydrogenase
MSVAERKNGREINGKGSGDWQATACILCSQNCGLQVQLDGRSITKIKGDKAHPASEGYACQKAQRVDHYQNGVHRLTSPLRRCNDGSYEEVSWDTAVREIAQKIVSIRDTYGGHALAQFGGGGQGNHLGGAYLSSLRAAMGTRYVYSSLAQEKTGGFWLDGKLFGKQNCHPAEDVHNSDFVLFIGTNPWQSHGFPQARTVLQEIAKDPNRKMAVIDPRRTETAEKADYFLQVRPGGDAHLLLAMLGTIVQEGLENKAFIEDHCTEYDNLRTVLSAIPVDEYALESGVDPDAVRELAREYAAANHACVRTDLGLEQTEHSTLNLYLSKLLFLLTGNLGKKGGNVFHTAFVPVIAHSKEPEEGGLTTKVTGMKEIGRLFPPNTLPLEIDTDHPDRVRGLIVDSGNPAMTAADSQAMRTALSKLELLVVIDVAMTETARHAHYVLPASSQYEKWECTFFSSEFPKNYFHLRKPILPPLEGTLAEPEIYRRILVAMGELPESFPDLEAAAVAHREAPEQNTLPMALMSAVQENPKWSKFAPIVLYATLGKALPDGANSAAVLWAASQRFAKMYPEDIRRAGIEDEGAGLGEAMFSRILTSPSGTLISEGQYEENLNFLKHKDGKIHLTVPEMLGEIAELSAHEPSTEFPMVLQAGERRAYNANQIIRKRAWRKKDQDGALRVHPDDAAQLGLEDGGMAKVETARGAIDATVSITDEMRRGMVSLPHGYGMLEQKSDQIGDTVRIGPDINVLSDLAHCDRIARTPFHKQIPARVTALTATQVEEATHAVQ